jgi:hypothetical protein
MSAAPRLRSADEVMRLSRLGAAHPTRLSFLRAMLRGAFADGWRYSVAEWNLDRDGFGHAVLRIETPQRCYSLVSFSRPLADEDRTDRVIATAWDASFVLYDGIPDAAEIERLATNAPRQEAGRFSEKDLVLCRANKSVRLFEHVAGRLAAGLQPDPALLREVGYLMRSTAVYGNGKFGIADRAVMADRAEFAGPFRAEMLSVWLVRAFTVLLVEHVARMRAPTTAVGLDAELRRLLGVGNSTGLGMAPFMVRHPVLVHRWFEARESALARVRAVREADAATLAGFASALGAMQATVGSWHTGDTIQSQRIAVLAAEIDALQRAWRGIAAEGAHPWDRIYRHAERAFSLEGQEAVVAVLLEPQGALIDDLADRMSADEDGAQRIDGAMPCASMKRLVDETYGWVRAIDFADPTATARFWYVSEEKLEPRLGERAEEDGADLELPLAVARDIAGFSAALARAGADEPLSAFLRRAPEWRHAARRTFIAAGNPYSEIRDNLIAASMRPIDLMRAKLAFFGASHFDPRSDRWVRISLFAGMPHPDELGSANLERSIGDVAMRRAS